MAHESAIQRLREANPITNPADLVEERIDAHLFLAAIKRRSNEMGAEFEQPTIEQDGNQSFTDVEVATTQEPARPRRTALLVGAAFALMILVAGFLVLLNRDSTSDVASDAAQTTAAEPAAAASEEAVFGAESSLAVVDDYFAAHNLGDIDAVFALFTAAATFSDTWSPSMDRTGWEPRFAWDMAQGEMLVSPDCGVVDEVPDLSVTISCAYGTRDAVVVAVDAIDIPTTTEMKVTPDGISTIRESYGQPDFTNTGNPFLLWMREQNPDDAEATSCCEGDTVAESVARGELRAQYATEWAAYLEANDCTYRDFSC